MSAQLPFNVAVDSEISFEDYRDLLNRHAELPMPGTRSAAAYAAIAKELERKAGEVLAEPLYDDAYILYRRCLKMIEERVWPQRATLDTDKHSEVSGKELREIFASAMSHQETVMQKLPQLHSQHMAEISKTKEHRQRVIAAAMQSAAQEPPQPAVSTSPPPPPSLPLQEGAVPQQQHQQPGPAVSPADAEREHEERRRRLMASEGPTSLFGGPSQPPPPGPPPTTAPPSQPPLFTTAPGAPGFGPSSSQPPAAPPAAPNVDELSDAERRRLVSERDKRAAASLASGLGAATVDHRRLEREQPSRPSAGPAQPSVPDPTTQRSRVSPPSSPTGASAARPTWGPQSTSTGPPVDVTGQRTVSTPPSTPSPPARPRVDPMPTTVAGPGGRPGVAAVPQQPLPTPATGGPSAPQVATPAAPAELRRQQPTSTSHQAPVPTRAVAATPAQPSAGPTVASNAILRLPAVTQALLSARLALWRFPTSSASGSPGPRRRGLVNLGNTCYINSALQCLASTPVGGYFQTDNYIDSIADRYTGGGKIANTFTFVVRELRQNVAGPVSASNLKRWIAKKNDRFDNFSQQDSDEFVKALLDGLHEDLNSRKGAKGTGRDIETRTRSDAAIAKDYLDADSMLNASPVHELLRFQQRGTILCTKCHEASRTFSVATSVPLDIPNLGRPLTLEDCFAHLTKESRLSGDSAYGCPRCRTKTMALSQTTLYSTPPVLVITLKRFLFFDASASKNNVDIAFQPEIDVSPYVTGPTPPAQCRYRLVGVVNHQGTLGGGHYTADVRGADGRWWYCSDEDVRPATTPSFSKAYMLFYQRMGAGASHV